MTLPLYCPQYVQESMINYDDSVALNNNNNNVASSLYTNYTANHHISHSNFNNNNNNALNINIPNMTQQSNPNYHVQISHHHHHIESIQDRVASNIFTIQTDTNIMVHGLQQIHSENTRTNGNDQQIQTNNNKWMIKPSLFNLSRLKFRMNMNRTNYNKNLQNLSLPEYQSRHNKMVTILHEYETLPLYLVTGFIREIGIEQIDEIIIPQDLINLCFKFYQHEDMAKLIDSKDNDELYTLAWEATEKEEYLFAEQIINYLLKYKLNAKKQRRHLNDNVFKIGTNKVKSTSRCSTSEDASTTNLMAVIKYFMKDYVGSEKYFKMASSIDPTCDIIMNNYAVLLLEQERFEDAEAEIIKAIRCNPTCIKNHQQYAYILFTMGKYELAAKECQLMIILEPNIESYSGYAWLLEQMGRFHESVLQYQELIALEPDNAIWYFWYAVLLQRCQQYNESRKNFKKCLDIDPNYEGANGAYAYSLYINGDYNEALKYIQIAIERDDNNHLCVHYYYSLIMIKLNNVQTAVNELYQCLDLIQLHQQNQCKNEKGCLSIQEHHIYDLLTELGYN